MSSCPIPANEAERLASVHLYNILDTAPEIEFDVTTRIAAALFSAPIALVALMDSDRLWFKSKHGLGLTQLDRRIAFCAHAIANPDDLLIVNDLRKDSRFDGNPLVYGAPGIRFYAGAPLSDSNGLALGTLAILATKPREFDSRSQALLRDLSVSVMTAIESRYRATMLEKLATTDSLTGLSNRLQFQFAAALEMRQAQLSEKTIGVLYMDLDGFKVINDSLGHSAGDAVLREVAMRMKHQLRDGETLARLGGDEFALVMRGGADLRSAQAIAERIVESLRIPVILAGGRSVTVGVSIGISLVEAHSATLPILIEQADHALYRAKAQSNQRWAVFGDASKVASILPL